MTVYSMFQVPIIHYEIENWDHNKKRILDAIPPECPEHADPQDNGLYTDFFLTAAAVSYTHLTLPTKRIV